jgi:uncharacterized Zn-finger protein
MHDEGSQGSQVTKANEAKIECDLCHRLYSTKGNLKSHIEAIHKRKKPFKCSFENCSKSYSNTSRLTIHQRTHVKKIFFKFILILVRG